MSRTDLVFVGALLGVGLATGVVLAMRPDLLAVLPTPALAVPLGAALVMDLAARPLAGQGRIAPLTMNARILGVIGAGLAAIAVSAQLAR